MATAARTRYTKQRPRNDAYTGLLTISLLALIVSSVLLYLDYNQYGSQKPPTVPVIKASAGGGGAPVGGGDTSVPAGGAGAAPTGGGPMGGAGPMGGTPPMGPMGGAPMPMTPAGGGPMNPGGGGASRPGTGT